MKNVPTFAVAGDPNVGKSTVIATLTEEDAVVISNRAGTTKVATPYTASIDGTAILQFIDLPGFENTPQLREWFELHRNDSGNLGNAFVAEFHDAPRFKAEREILRSIDGAAVIFVVDATRPVQQRDRDQAEILRLCTDKRMAVINIKSNKKENSEDPQILQDWKDLLGKHFTYECFDSHQANFQDRIELLETISRVMPGWRDLMKDAIQRFRDDWQQRRIPEVASELCELLENVMKIRVRESLNKGQNTAEKAAKQRVENKVRKLEETFRKKVRGVFQHKRGDWEMPPGDVLDQDIFSEQVWKLFGLTKVQLVYSGALIGAAIGAGIDVMVGGLFFFTGAIIGAGVGAAGGFIAAGKAVDFHIATEHAEARVAPKSNLIWILIDRGLLYIRATATWSHGRRETTRVVDGAKSGITAGWEEADKKIVIQWIGALCSEKFGSNRTQQFEQNAQAQFSREVSRLTASMGK